MRNSIVVLLLCILSGMQLLSCKKGQPLEGEQFMELTIPSVFSTDDSLDMYVDGRLELSRVNKGGSLDKIILKRKDQITVSIHKAGTDIVLKDTTVTVTTEKITLSYAYDASLGFNQFVKSGDFARPGADSIAFILINKYTDFGSGKINVTIYRNNSYDYTANPADSVTTIKNIALGKMSEKVVLPDKAADGTKNLYVIVVRDAVTGVDGNGEYITDYGQPVNSAYNYLNKDACLLSSPGNINGIVINSLLYDGGGKIYNMPDTGIAFQL